MKLSDSLQPLFGSKLYSIWGAPNFFDRCGNVGAIAEIDDVLNITFNCVLPVLHFSNIYHCLDQLLKVVGASVAAD